MKSAGVCERCSSSRRLRKSNTAPSRARRPLGARQMANSRPKNRCEPSPLAVSNLLNANFLLHANLFQVFTQVADKHVGEYRTSTPMDRHIINESPRTNIRTARCGPGISMPSTVAPVTPTGRSCFSTVATTCPTLSDRTTAVSCRSRRPSVALPRTGPRGRSCRSTTQTRHAARPHARHLGRGCRRQNSPEFGRRGDGSVTVEWIRPSGENFGRNGGVGLDSHEDAAAHPSR